MTLHVPKYRFHRGSGQALVQINGQRIYLGVHGTAESHEKYRRIVAQWLESRQTPPVSDGNGKADDLTYAVSADGQIRFKQSWPAASN